MTYKQVDPQTYDVEPGEKLQLTFEMTPPTFLQIDNVLAPLQRKVTDIESRLNSQMEGEVRILNQDLTEISDGIWHWTVELKAIEASPIIPAIVAVLTSWQFWVGFSVFASAMVMMFTDMSLIEALADGNTGAAAGIGAIGALALVVVLQSKTGNDD